MVLGERGEGRDWIIENRKDGDDGQCYQDKSGQKTPDLVSSIQEQVEKYDHGNQLGRPFCPVCGNGDQHEQGLIQELFDPGLRDRVECSPEDSEPCQDEDFGEQFEVGYPQSSGLTRTRQREYGAGQDRSTTTQSQGYRQAGDAETAPPRTRRP